MMRTRKADVSEFVFLCSQSHHPPQLKTFCEEFFAIHKHTQIIILLQEIVKLIDCFLDQKMIFLSCLLPSVLWMTGRVHQAAKLKPYSDDCVSVLYKNHSFLQATSYSSENYSSLNHSIIPAGKILPHNGHTLEQVWVALNFSLIHFFFLLWLKPVWAEWPSVIFSPIERTKP